MADTTGIFDNAFATTQRTINSGFGTQLFRNAGTDTSYSIDATDSTDFFRLRLSRRSSVVLTLNELSANLDLALLDNSGGALQTSTNGGNLAEALVSDPLDAGDYYIRVSAGSPGVVSNYTLGVNTVDTNRADLLWRNSVTGQNAVWLMNGTSLGSALLSTTVGDLNWSIEATGDMNGDSTQDYIWRNRVTGQNAVWLMDGNTLRSVQFLSPVGGTWSIEGAADFNADGKTDLVWRNISTGQNVIWLMDGVTLNTGIFLPGLVGNWEINAVGDFNGDSNPDLVWRNYTTGQNLIWMMNGTTLNSTQQITTLNDVNWRMFGAGDFNGDGQQDLAWRNYASGQNVVWQMNGTTLLSASPLAAVSATSWRVAAVITGAPTIDLAGNTLGTAFSIGRANTNGLYSDTIGSPSDRNDYYRFTLSTPISLSLSLNGLSADADLQLIADFNNNGLIDAGETIATSAATGIGNEAISNQSLQAVTGTGQTITYYIRVYSDSTQRTSYTLNLTGTSAQQIDLRLSNPTVAVPNPFRLTTTSNAALPATINIGTPQTVRINYAVFNESLSVTPAQFNVGFYLSRDRVITPGAAAGGDLLIGSAIISNLAANTSTGNRTLDITLPAAINSYWGGDQTYYIGMYIDTDNQVAESIEINNTAVAPISIIGTLNPDVVGDGLTSSQVSSAPGQAIRVTGAVRNIGNVSTGQGQQFFIRFYFSNDDIADQGDWDFNGASAVISTIAANSRTTFDSNITQSTQPNYFTGALVLPNTTWSGWRGNGRYYVAMEVNYFNLVPETDGGRENNLNYGRQIGSFIDYTFIDITGAPNNNV